VRFGGVQALDDVSLSVLEGEICALVGPNGAGKTTLFNCLSGIVVPDGGRMYAAGYDVTHMPAHRRAALGLARTFQSVELFTEQSVLDNVAIAAHVRRTSGPFAEALALPASYRSERAVLDKSDVALHRLQIEHIAGAAVSELNAVDLRRLELACVLVREPSILLLDEPTAGLSPTESVELARVVASLRDELGVTIVLVEHDMTVVGEIAEWVYVLDFGRVIASGTPPQIRRNRTVIDRYLGAAHARSA
jgi:branched-chain amino acid transport system ATP-binding protein